MGLSPQTNSEEVLLGGGLTPARTVTFAFACGAMAANLYYAQPLVGVIGSDLKLTPSLAGFVVTLAQVGYGVGLLFIVSLADRVENRRLILLMTSLLVFGLVGAAMSKTAAMFLLSSFVIGLSSVSAQILIPLATFMAPFEQRGRVIGNVMSGLLMGIMLARPLAGFVAGAAGWRAVFWVSAALILIVLALLSRMAPVRRPNGELGVVAIVASTLGLLRTTPILRRRAVNQGLLFASFNLFWTSAPLMLKQSFGLSQTGVALFALAGAGGALSAPLAGRLADRGLSRAASAIAMVGAALSFLLAAWSGQAGFLFVCAFAAICLDACIQANHIVSQRIIFGLQSDNRGRLNSAYMTVMFMSGAFGSTIGAYVFVEGGWLASSAAGAALCGVAFTLFASQPGP